MLIIFLIIIIFYYYYFDHLSHFHSGSQRSLFLASPPEGESSEPLSSAVRSSGLSLPLIGALSRRKGRQAHDPGDRVYLSNCTSLSEEQELRPLTQLRLVL